MILPQEHLDPIGRSISDTLAGATGAGQASLDELAQALREVKSVEAFIRGNRGLSPYLRGGVFADRPWESHDGSKTAAAFSSFLVATSDVGFAFESGPAVAGGTIRDREAFLSYVAGDGLAWATVHPR